MNYNKSYLLAHVGLWTGVVIGILGALIEIRLIAYMSIILMLGSLVQTLIFYKCPNCKKPFNIRGKKPKYCPECGCTLE
ncbi:hypothetical protein SAMN05446037_102742 [Anaerovirgula multivorans]|uniref:Zinc-ribbon domain-containing protein n=1 Tax=Anaerovirgula multivorans TaxID=312168 RepID=A0A239IEV4_9FIRM|nr:hypothetical protein [Anaerovirgula multivorans]SNS91788.1 hypothetical protein SAMN05446037_102742 [Anaerovirgula multivorans]